MSRPYLDVEDLDPDEPNVRRVRVTCRSCHVWTVITVDERGGFRYELTHATSCQVPTAFRRAAVARWN